ncbi:MAG: precorrin-4 C(11)-methyltransferase [Myxococcales bacterium]|nr:precorrin-4 C(11)-methyltransferase [Myxococcales bacterium]
MTVHFIGAGPGAPDLLTIRAQKLISACPVCLYAGSVVSEAILDYCPPGAKRVNTAPLTLEEIIEEFDQAHQMQQDVARLHSGDVSIWSAMAEQQAYLRLAGIPYDVTPGVPSFAAAAARVGVELTLPTVVQSVVLTRTPGRASSMPSTETLAHFAQSGAVLAIHLSIHQLDGVVAELVPYYGAASPAAVVYRASWPEEQVIIGTLGSLEAQVGHMIRRSAIIFVGPSLHPPDTPTPSSLYQKGYSRRFRSEERE